MRWTTLFAIIIGLALAGSGGAYAEQKHAFHRARAGRGL